ncbi:MAG: FAD-dependent oxidoreductase [bacterium]
MQINDEYDVVVIGAGISGMSTAAILSRRGFRCAVLEKKSCPGGRASWIEKNGFIVDFGIHINRYAAQGKAAEVLRLTGEQPRFLPVDKPVLFTRGKFISLPSSPVEIITTPLLSFKSRLRLLKFLFKIVSARSADDLYKISVQEWLHQNNITEGDITELVQVLSGAGIVCPDLDRASAGELFFFLRSALKAQHTTGYFLGGWRSLFAALERAVNTNGVILYNTKVDEVILKNGNATGVRCGENFFQGKTVVSSLPLQEVESIIPEKCLPAKVLQYARSLEPTCGIVYDFCLKKRVSDINGIILTSDPCTMGLFVSNIEPALAPRGKQIGNWFYPIPYEKMNDHEFLNLSKRHLQGILDNMFPHLRGEIEFERTMELSMVDSAMPCVGQTSADRPAVDCSPVPNFFIVGDSVGAEGHGGDIAFASAITCAQKIEQLIRSVVS